ncbi:unnamed protein product [Nezara viridula]|uniref:Uncharacterized protein n=1 Tax=Nezara viridula TaxID=85310 RepID=A0A9P0HSL9_NEZVI|nr:unnamed protein product [Nezara viridula]
MLKIVKKFNKNPLRTKFEPYIITVRLEIGFVPNISSCHAQIP